VEVMHAFMPIALTSAPMTTEPIPLPLSAADVERELTAKTAQLAELGVHYGVTPERVHVHTGVPVTVLPNMAQELAADIVAMGAISRSAIERFLIGSTAESVLEDLPCDALIVKPVDFASALPLWSMRQAG
jgi:universal stress protein E